MNKNKIIIGTLLIFCTFFSYSNKIKKIELIDKDYCFDEVNYLKNYNINSSTKEIEIGIFIVDEILEQDMELGNLEVEIILENENVKKILYGQNVKLVYKDFKKRLVNKIYFETIDFFNVQVIKEIKVKVLNRFLINENTCLIITNLNSSLFFDS